MYISPSPMAVSFIFLIVITYLHFVKGKSFHIACMNMPDGHVVKSMKKHEAWRV